MTLDPRLKLGAAALALAGAGYAIHQADVATRVTRVEDAFPEATYLAATLDVVALKSSPVFGVLFGPDSGRVFGLRDLEARCGFDPADRMDRIGFVVPEKGDKGEFGAAFRVRATGEELSRCAAGGGDGAGAGTMKKEGRFFVVETPRSGARIAYRPDNASGGVLLLGKGDWLAEMTAALAGRAPRIGAGAAHGGLLRRLDAAGPLTLRLTVALPRDTRERIRGEMARKSANTAASLARMSGVLGVEAAGLGVALGPDVSTLRVELTCETPDDCASTKGLIDETRFKLQKDIVARLVAGPFIDALEVTLDGTTLSARTAGRTEDLARAISRVLERGGPVDPGEILGDRARKRP